MAITNYYVSTTGLDTNAGTQAAPFATPGYALGQAIALTTTGWNIFVATGNYPVTSATANAASGVLNFSQTGALTAYNRMIGVNSSWVEDGSRFTLTLAAGLNATALTMNNANSYNECRQVNFVGNATSGAGAINGAGRSNLVRYFKASGFTGGNNHIVSIGDNFIISDFEVSGGATANYAAINAATGASVIRGWQHGNAGRGIDCAGASPVYIVDVVSSDNTTSNGYGFDSQGINTILVRCTADNNAAGNYAIITTGSAQLFCDQCVSTRSGAYDWLLDGQSGAIYLRGCAAYGATSGNFDVTPDVNENFTALAAMPYNGAGDYGLTKGENPITQWTLPGGTSIAYENVGATQPASGGGGVPRIVVPRRMW